MSQGSLYFKTVLNGCGGDIMLSVIVVKFAFLYVVKLVWL